MVLDLCRTGVLADTDTSIFGSIGGIFRLFCIRTTLVINLIWLLARFFFQIPKMLLKLIQNWLLKVQFKSKISSQAVLRLTC